MQRKGGVVKIQENQKERVLCGARTNIVRCSARICATVKFIHFFTEFIFLRNSQQFINIKNSCMSGGGGMWGTKANGLVLLRGQALLAASHWDQMAIMVTQEFHVVYIFKRVKCTSSSQCVICVLNCYSLFRILRSADLFKRSAQCKHDSKRRLQV